MRKKSILVIATTLIAILSFGFIKGGSVLDILKRDSAEKSSFVSPPPAEEIVGMWKDEAEPGHKLEFLNNGELKIYSEGIYDETCNYQISATCDGKVFDGQFLKLTYPGQDSEFCYYIEGINEGGSNILSLMGTNGHMETYVKQ